MCQVVTYHQGVLADDDTVQVGDLVDLEVMEAIEDQAGQVEDHPEDLEDLVDPAEVTVAMVEDQADQEVLEVPDHQEADHPMVDQTLGDTMCPNHSPPYYLSLPNVI